MKLLLALVFAVFFASARAKSSWSSCGKPDYPIKITDARVQPDPPVGGSDMSFVVNATSTTPIDAGCIYTTVKWHGFPVHWETDDLCSKTSCPVNGDFYFTKSASLPEVAQGNFKVNLMIYTPKSKPLACADVNFEIVKPVNVM